MSVLAAAFIYLVPGVDQVTEVLNDLPELGCQSSTLWRQQTTRKATIGHVTDVGPTMFEDIRDFLPRNQGH